MSRHRSYRRVYLMLVAHGHSEDIAEDIVRSAQRDNPRALRWIKLVRRARRS